ncbi:hypothetical protein M0R04_09055 [Candidatus Dojkabacteria bacterium]|jgi:hypothetical protein|nr:hypothetical protein [Candidatus Dojkabacteria bacterium]
MENEDKNINAAKELIEKDKKSTRWMIITSWILKIPFIVLILGSWMYSFYADMTITIIFSLVIVFYMIGVFLKKLYESE